jgi:ABC-type multidrug transport system permease subunit
MCLTLEIMISEFSNSKIKILQSVIKISPLVIVMSSISFYPYQKDEWALPGNLRTKGVFYLPGIKCLSLLPHNFLTASFLLLSFITLSSSSEG